MPLLETPSVAILNHVSAKDITSTNKIEMSEIASINGISVNHGSKPSCIAQISLADGSWQEPQTPGGWQHFFRDVSKIRLIDDSDLDTGWDFSRSATCAGGTDGENPGLYPAICEDLMNCNAIGALTYSLSNLDNAKTYSFEFWCGFEAAQRPWEANNGKTQFAISGYTSVSILHKGYTGSPVFIENVAPFNGEIVINVSNIDGATYWYFNVLVIRQFTP